MPGTRVLNVYGFQRSGNHLLAWLLKNNLYDKQDLSSTLHGYGHYTARRACGRVLSYKKLFQNPHGLPPKDISNAVYIYRDGRSVARSLWLSDGYRSSRWADDQFSEWLRSPLTWRFSNMARASNDLSVIEHWKEMVDMWMASGCTLVQYERLVLQPEIEVEKIAIQYGLEIPVQFVFPEYNVGLSPSYGGFYGWKTLFSEEDLQYFHTIVPKNHQGVYNAGKA